MFLSRTEQQGMVLVDVLLAMTLAAFFVSIFSIVFSMEEKSFVRAQGRIVSLTASSTSVSIDLDTVTIPSLFPIHIPVSSMPVCSSNFEDFIRPGSSIHTSTTTSRLATPTIKDIILPIPPTLPLTHLEVRGSLALISADSPVYADPDIFVFDISPSTSSSTATSTYNAHLVSYLNTGPGIASFVLAGRRIFAAASSIAGQVHTIGFTGTSSPDYPFLENKYKLSPPYATATLPYATAIAFSSTESPNDYLLSTGDISPQIRSFLYLGTEKWDGSEFSIVDVTDPHLPVLSTGLEVGARVADIATYSGKVYIANAGVGQLIVSKVNPVIAENGLVIDDSLLLSGWSRQTGKVISVSDYGLVFGRTSGGYDITTDHELFSIATTSIVDSQSLSNASGLFTRNIPGGVYGVVQDKDHVYIITNQVGAEFQIFDHSLSTSSVFLLPTQPQSITCDGHKIYILSRTSPHIYEITF